MLNPHLPDPQLLEAILEPLLDDFQYWFDRSVALLENEKISFLGTEAQTNLLGRIRQAQEEVKTAGLLLKATDGQAGVQMEVVMSWHLLLTECWQVAARYRMENSSHEGETT